METIPLESVIPFWIVAFTIDMITSMFNSESKVKGRCLQIFFFDTTTYSPRWRSLNTSLSQSVQMSTHLNLIVRVIGTKVEKDLGHSDGPLIRQGVSLVCTAVSQCSDQKQVVEKYCKLLEVPRWLDVTT